MSWQKDAVERRTIWPYQVSPDPIKATFVGRFLLKGMKIGDVFEQQNWKQQRKKVVETRARWDAFSVAHDWDHLELDVAMQIDRPDQFATVPASYSVDVLCKQTRYRSAVSRPFLETGVTITLRIPRKDLVGEVLVSPLLLLTAPFTSRSVLHPQRKGSRLAVGFPLHIQVDTPHDRPGAGIEVVWFPFPEEIQDALYDLLLTPPHPILRINNRHPALKVVFESRAKTGSQARIRNAIFSLIASDVWFQLAEYAVAIYKQELEDEEDPSFVLSRKIIRTLSRMIRQPAEEILRSFEDASSRSALSLRIQNHLKALSHQNSLVHSMVAEESLEFE